MGVGVSLTLAWSLGPFSSYWVCLDKAFFSFFPCIVASCYASCHWEVCSFVKGSWATDLGERVDREAWKREGISDCSLDVLYRRRIKQKLLIKNVWRIREFSVRLSFNMSETLTAVSTAWLPKYKLNMGNNRYILSMNKVHRMCLGISISMSRWDCDCSIWYAGKNQL